MMTPTYDPALVILSVVIAMLASFAALNFAAHVTSASGSTRLGWQAGGASVMGMGIWSMHFVGMLAFHLPVTIEYGLLLMLLSVGGAIVASLLALMVASRRAMSGRVLLTAGLLLGAAIAGMHYTGMAAARFTPGAMPLTSGAHVLATDELGQAIGVGALLMLGVALVGLVVDRRVLEQRVAFTERLEAQTHLLGRQKAALEAQTQALAAQTEELQVQPRSWSQAEELAVQAEQLVERAAEQDRLNATLTEANAQLASALGEAERTCGVEHAANVFRTRFVNMVTHELRTPVGAIGGYVQLLLMGLRGPVTGAQERDLRRIDANQQHLLRLINEILDLAKLEAGQMPLHLAEVELRDVLDATRPMIEPQLMAKRITYSPDLGESTPRVHCDPGRVQQILINLLANSIKFTPPSGTIRVTAGRCGERVEIRVTDSGPGVPADKLDSLFTPFQQLGVEGEHAAGTGLGLSISRELARAMGGELGIGECTPREAGGGATFILSLNVAAGTPSRVAPT